MAKLPARDNECVQGQRDTGFGWPHSSHCACNLPDPDLPWVKQGCCLLRRWRIVLIVCILASQNNSCDQNLNLCLELIEQVAKVQGQLFGILTTAAQEGENGHGFHIVLPSFLFVCVLCQSGWGWTSLADLMCVLFQEDIMRVWKPSSPAFCLGWRLPSLLLPWGNLLTARCPLYR